MELGCTGISVPVPGTTRGDLREFVLARELALEKLGAAWGLAPGSVSSRLAGHPPLTSDQVEITLAVLGLDPVEFHRGVAERFHPELELHAFVKPARRNIDRFQVRLLERPPEKSYSQSELAAMATGLESLRFRDPAEARRQAGEILRSPDLESDVAAEAWGVLAVLYRHRGHAAIAAHCLTHALRLGGGAGVRGRTLQRLAMLLLFNAGTPEKALIAIRRAREIYRLSEEATGVGKTYVDEGIVHGMTGEHRRARRADLRALRYLDQADSANRFAALQGVAVAAVFLGKTEEAVHYLDEAAGVLRGDEKSLYFLSTVWWLQGELALLLGHYRKASEYFVAVWDAFLDLEIGPVEVTLISLRIAKAYWLQGDREGYRQVFQDLVARENEVHAANPLLGPALSQFLRQSAEEATTSSLLEEAYLRLREGVANIPPLLPAELPSNGL